jgi:hypothetical protein
VFVLALLFSVFLESGHAGQSAMTCTVTAGGAPVVGAETVVAGRTYVTDRRGETRIDVTPGLIELTVVKAGFAPVTTTVTVAAGQEQAVAIELERLPSIQETVTVSATRADRGLEDQPMRVEVLDAEEIDEKLMMTPGDIVMMLNEMGGMRVQATSPSLGAASVRIPGMRGRYTRFLSDGERCTNRDSSIVRKIPAGRCLWLTRRMARLPGYAGGLVLLALCYTVVRWILQLWTLRVRSTDLRELEVVVLRHELAILRRRTRRPAITWTDRLFLAAASRVLPRARWRSFIITPETLLRWHRMLVAKRWISASGGAPADSPGDPNPGPSCRAREPAVGLSTHRRRTEGPWHGGLGDNSPHMASGRGSRPGRHARGNDLERVLASAPAKHARGRFLHS